MNALCSLLTVLHKVTITVRGDSGLEEGCHQSMLYSLRRLKPWSQYS